MLLLTKEKDRDESKLLMAKNILDDDFIKDFLDKNKNVLSDKHISNLEIEDVKKIMSEYVLEVRRLIQDADHSELPVQLTHFGYIMNLRTLKKLKFLKLSTKVTEIKRVQKLLNEDGKEKELA